MDIRNITADLSASPQITPEQVAELKSLGFAAIICNRPNGEAPDQPEFEAVAAAAEAAGMQALSIPISGPPVPPGATEAFSQALEALPGPILAYCRTGTRSTMLWALSQAGKRPVDEILERAKAAGYDLTPLAPALSVSA